MATIKFKRGITGPTGLTLGEPAWNYVDNKLYVGVTSSAIWVGGQIDTSTSLGTSNIKIPTQGAVKAYVDGAVSGSVQGVSAASAGTGISVSGATGAVTITNTGVISINGLTGSVTGVATATAGSGIAISGATAITITNTGVLSINGSTGSITNVARLNEGNTFSVRQIMNAGISAANLTVNSGVTFNNIDLRSTTSTIQGYNTAGYLKMQTTGTIMAVPGNPSIVLQDADTDIGGVPSITINASPSVAGTNNINIGNSTAITSITGTLSVSSTSTLTGRSTHTGGITAANLYVPGGATFNSRTSFNSGITSANLYVVGGSTFIGNISAPNIVNSNIAGTGISVSGATGNVTITNTGVQSFNGSTGAVSFNSYVSSFNGSTGAITGVSSVNGFTGAVSITYASAVTVTSTNAASTYYPTLSLGAGNTGLFVDNVTTPLSYVPSTGTLTVRSTSMISGANNTTIIPALVTLTDGTDVAAISNYGFDHNGTVNFSLGSNVGVLVNANFSVCDNAQSSYQYNFPTSSGSNGQVLTTDGGYPATLSWTTPGATFTSRASFSGGLTASNIYASGGVTFNSTSAHTGLATFSGGLTASGATFSGNVNLQDNVLSRVELLDYFERYVDLGDFTTTSTQIPIDLSTAQVFRTKLTVTCTGLNVTNTPDNGNANAVGFTFLLVGDGTARTMTWNIGNTAASWAGGTAPTYTSTANKIDVYSFLSRDGGSTWLGFVGGQNF